MQEEFHGIRNADNTATIEWKKKYGWGALNTNVWLPSVSELVGYDPNHYDDMRGCYKSIMQGLNTSVNYYVDAQGGEQFTWFQQFNASGGGEKLWNVCGGEETWLRSTSCATATHIYRITNPTNFNHALVVSPRAVHPAGDNEKHKKAVGCSNTPYRPYLRFFSYK